MRSLRTSLFAVLILTGCTSESAQLYPPLGNPTCTSHPHLCSGRITDLGGGDATNRFDIVFISEGYSESELDGYRQTVDRWLQQLREDGNEYASWHPSMYHFWRIDLSGHSGDVNNLERRDTALGAWNDPESDSCDGHFIATDDALRSFAVQSAANAAALGTIAAVVTVVKDSDGRANAAGGAHVSSLDTAKVVSHELAHSLFGLADEYTEFVRCSDRLATTETQLLSTANITTLPDPAKWQGVVTTAPRTGGNRAPCFFHPTNDCRMLDSTADAYCPVCTEAIERHLDVRQCLADSSAPRVTISSPDPALPSRFPRNLSEPIVPITVSAYDEYSIQSYRLELDDQLVSESPSPWHQLDLRSLTPGTHKLQASAIDAAGNMGLSAPIHFEWSIDTSPRINAFVAGQSANGFHLHVVGVAYHEGAQLESTINNNIVDTRIVPKDGFFNYTLPVTTDMEGVIEVAVTARASDGRVSPPTTTVVEIAPLSQTSPILRRITAPSTGQEHHQLAVGRSAILRLHWHSCGQLTEVGFRDQDGMTISSVVPPSQSGCDYHVLVPLRDSFDVTTFVAFATDVYGTTTLAPPWTPTRMTLDDCGISVTQPPNTAALSIANPGVFEITPTSLPSAVSIDATPVPSTQQIFGDKTRHTVSVLDAAAVLVGANTPAGQVRDVAIAIDAMCSGMPVTASKHFDLLVDSVPPEIAVHPMATRDGQLQLATAADTTTVEVVWPNGDMETATVPPFALSARDGIAKVTAIDRADNRTTITQLITNFAELGVDCE